MITRAHIRVSVSRVVVLASVAGVVAVPFASASTRAQGSFSGKVCSLFSAKQVATIVGDADTGKYACVPAKTTTTPVGTTYTATAGSSTTSGGGFFTIMVVKYENASLASLAQQQLKATMKPVRGVGDWAYSRIEPATAVGGTADGGQFSFGAKGYGVLITLRAKLKKTINQPALKTLAKKIVSDL
jgi:hypothetical protein